MDEIKILIVQADKVLTNSILEELEKKRINYTIEVTESEQEYIKTINTFSPAVIISGISSKELSGIKALHIRNKIAPAIPYILIAGDPAIEQAVEAMKSGADDYISGRDLSRLEDAIHSAIIKSEILRSKETAGRSLMETEAIFSAFMEHSPVYVFFKDKDARPIKLSRNFENMIGMPAEKAIGKTMDELFPSELSKTMVQDDLKVLKEKVPVRIVEELAGRVYETTKFPLFRQDGSQMLAGFTIDITEQKKAEEALKESEERYHAFINSSADLMFVKDDQYRYIIFNEATTRFFGKTKEELLLRTDYDLMDKIGADNCKISDQNALQKGMTVVFEEKIGEKTFETTKFPLRLKNSKVGVGAIIRDVTSHKKAEEALRVSRKEFQNYFNNSSVGLSVTSPERRWLEVNQKLCDILGYNKSELEGLTWVELSHPDELEENLSLLKMAIEGKIDKYELDKKYFRKDGSIVWASLSVVCQRNGDGTINHFLSSYVDITERKRFENELILAKEKAEESDRLKTAFLHNISHEIRTPMNAIVGFSALIGEDENLPDNLNQYSGLIIKSSEHLLEIVNDIIDISNIDAGTLKINKRAFSLPSYLDDLVSQLGPKAKEKGLTLSCHCEINADETEIETDKTRLSQVLINLINNAFKFTNAGGVTFGCLRKENLIQFYVSDTGIGINSDDFTKIFERFYQVGNAPSMKSEGTGLGLSISKGIIDKMGGTIWLESKPGSGSTFYFTIPFVKAKKIIEPDPVQPSKKESGPFQMKTVLITDDDKANTELLRLMLSGLGLNLLTASNGKIAVELCDSCKVDLVFMDIRMPVMDGFDATRLIKSSHPGLPVIALTAFAFETDRERIIECGCDGYLSKPFKKAALLEAIAKYL